VYIDNVAPHPKRYLDYTIKVLQDLFVFNKESKTFEYID